jgi:hypothetical protein
MRAESAVTFSTHAPDSTRAGPQTTTSLRGWGTAGEMVSLSFGVSSAEPIEDLTFTVSAVRHGMDVIAADRIDLFIVSVWTQAGIGVYQTESTRVAELLLKDDRVTFRDGFGRRTCRHLAHRLRGRCMYRPPDIRLDGDPRTSLAAHESKRVWMSVRIPSTAAPGIYEGAVAVAGDHARRYGTLPVQLEVLPFTLAEAEQSLFIWYKGTLDCRRPQHFVSARAFQAQLQDIYDHGFRSISLNEHEPAHLQSAIDVAAAVGFRNEVVLTAPYPERFARVNFRGLSPMYYVSDEIDIRGEAFQHSHADNVRRVVAACGRTMASFVSERNARHLSDNPADNADRVAYYLPANTAYFAAVSAFPSLRERNASYYWQSHMEKPNLHRVLAGLYLWKSKAGGIAPYCYQHLPQAPNSPFDDFDEWEPGFHVGSDRRPFKDHMTTYPARSGSIPTLQWKGLADGICDLRYLTTLEAALGRADACGEGDVRQLAEQARLRRDRFLARVSLTTLEIASDTDPEPYAAIRPEEYADFREQLARDTAALLEAVRAPVASRAR